MKKILYFLLGGALMITGTVYAITIFNSNQVGSSPSNGKVLQTDGTVSTWVATSTLGISSSGSSFPFTQTSYGVSTSTIVNFTGGLMANASSTINSTFHLPTLSLGNLWIDGTGLVQSSATTTAGTGLSYSGNAFNVNTSQSISTLSNLTTNGAVYTSGGTGALNTNSLFTFDGTNLGIGTSTPGSLFSVGNTTGINFTVATSTFKTTGGIDLRGGGCFSISGVCLTQNTGTVTSVGLSDSNSTLTIGSTPVTTSGTITATLNLGHANTWSALQQFANASSTTFSAGYLAVGQTATSTIDRAGGATFQNSTTTGEQTIPIGTNPTIGVNGDIGVDTTNNQFLFYSGGLNVLTGTTTPSFNIASTTLDEQSGSFSTGTTTLIMKNSPEPLTLLGAYCISTSTGSTSYRLGGASTWTAYSTCDTGGTVKWFSSNNTFTAFQSIMVQMGKITATIPSRVTLTLILGKTRQ